MPDFAPAVRHPVNAGADMGTMRVWLVLPRNCSLGIPVFVWTWIGELFHFRKEILRNPSDDFSIFHNFKNRCPTYVPLLGNLSNGGLCLHAL